MIYRPINPFPELHSAADDRGVLAAAVSVFLLAPPLVPSGPRCSEAPEIRALEASASEHLARGDTRAGGTLDEAREAVRLLEDVTRHDPACAEAWISLATAWSRFSFSVPGSLSNAETYPQEEAASLKALALDGGNPRVHAL